MAGSHRIFGLVWTPAARLSLAYFGLFGLLGVLVPFWSIWLTHRGIAPAQIGVLLSLRPWAVVISNLGVGQLSGQLRRPAAMVRWLALAIVAGYGVMAWARTFSDLLIASAFVGLVFAPIIPLLDSLTLNQSRRGGLSYANTRLWGSIGFVLMSALAGASIKYGGDGAVLTLVCICSVVFAIASRWLPSTPPLASRLAPSVKMRGSWSMLRRPEIRWVILTAGALQGSHALLYAFGSKIWRMSGVDERTIGWLWALGTACEILVFWAGDRLIRRWSATGLMLMAAFAGVIRWSLLSTTPELGGLLIAQALHAATFGCAHLGVMTYVRERTPEHETAATSTLIAGLGTGLATALGFLISGWLFVWWDARAFLAMAVVSMVGGIAALRLRTTRPSNDDSDRSDDLVDSANRAIRWNRDVHVFVNESWTPASRPDSEAIEV